MDITMCNNKECPFKETCLRFKGTPNEYRQSYTEFKPYVNENEDLTCDYFIKSVNTITK